MRKYMFFIIALYCSCQQGRERTAVKTDCDRFKTGKFLHEAKGSPVVYRIERNDSIQKEIIGKTGDYANFKITWTDPCTYELTFLNQSVSNSDSVSESLKKGIKVKVQIQEVRNDTCFVMAYAGGRQLPGIVYADKP